GDAPGLADARRPDARELLADLVRETVHGGVVERLGQRRVVVPARALDLGALLIDVARVARLRLEAQDAELGVLRVLGLDALEPGRGADAGKRRDVAIADLRALQQRERGCLARERAERVAFRHVGRAHDDSREPRLLGL